MSSAGRPGLSSTTCTDYQAQGINPANLGFDPSFDGMHQTIGFAELGFSAYSNGMGKFDLRTTLYNPDKIMSTAEKMQAATNLAGKRIVANVDFLYAGYAWQRVSGGSGFAFTVREKAQWYSEFNESVAGIFLNGKRDQTYFGDPILERKADTVNQQNQFDTVGAYAKTTKPLAQIFNGSRVAMSWNREYAFAYGVNIIKDLDWKVNLGIGIKYIEGIGYLDVQSDGSNLKAFVSSSPYFDLRYGSNGSLRRAKDSVNQGVWPNSVGHGVGFEMGTTIMYRDKFRFSAALSDLGSVVYSTNVFTASSNEISEIRNDGFSSLDFYRNSNRFDGIQKDILRWESIKKRSQFLPTKLRFGIAITKEKWSLGFETILPMNNSAGNFRKPFYSFGGEIRVVEWLKIGTGMMYGGNIDQILVPFGINFITSGGLWEMGIGSRDILTYVRDDNAMLSLCTAVMRFRF